jgi:hypothetical protein
MKQKVVGLYFNAMFGTIALKSTCLNPGRYPLLLIIMIAYDGVKNQFVPRFQATPAINFADLAQSKAQRKLWYNK